MEKMLRHAAARMLERISECGRARAGPVLAAYWLDLRRAEFDA